MSRASRSWTAQPGLGDEAPAISGIPLLPTLWGLSPSPAHPHPGPLFISFRTAEPGD